eukprot:2827614-Prymnesium_polylepis.1
MGAFWRHASERRAAARLSVGGEEAEAARGFSRLSTNKAASARQVQRRGRPGCDSKWPIIKTATSYPS